MFFHKKESFCKAINEWLMYKKSSIKISTFYRYKYIINKYIISYFKKENIYDFENYNFSNYINYLSKTLSPKTVNDIIVVLKSILKYVEKNYNVSYNLGLIAIPKKKNKEIQTLENNDIKKLENFCIDTYNPKYIGIIVCLNTGLRIGEICALKWEDIDLKNKLIFVNKTVQRVYKGKNDTEIRIDEPKSYNSIRKIPISNKLLLILKKIKKKYKINNNMYFLTSSEKLIEPRNYYSFFKKVLKLCKIQDYSFHILRHTFATNCIKIGMDAKSLSEILGHSDVKLTLNRYVHSSYSRQKYFLDKL